MSPADQLPTLIEVQYQARQRLTAADIETPALDARVMVQHAIGLTHEALILSPDRAVDRAELERFVEFLERRLRHEPVSRIIGQREFYGRCFAITPDVLDPRPDTEVLVDRVIEIARVLPAAGPVRILDIGTGSGAIIVTLMAELPAATGTASDISLPALEVARLNARRLLETDCIEFIHTSWFDGVTTEFDVIVSNPPYIRRCDLMSLGPDVARYDPPIALDGGVDGLDAYRALASKSFDRLAPGGYLCLEVGIGQAEPVSELMREFGFASGDAVHEIGLDLAGRPRIVIGQKVNC